MGDGAVLGSTTGFQRSVVEWIAQAGLENERDVILYCMGYKDDVRPHETHPNVTIKQYKPHLEIWDAIPFVPAEVFPFRVDMVPLHIGMVTDILAEKPDIIHTLQTFGATDIAGFIAAHVMKARGRPVRLVNTVTTEIDTYFGIYVKTMADYFFKQIGQHSFLQLLRDSARVGSAAADGDADICLRKLIGHAPPLAFWYGAAKLADALGKRSAAVKLISDIFRGLLRGQIPAYLNHCDAVTISRPEDVSRYTPRCPVWEVPSTCDLKKFKVHFPLIDEFLSEVDTRRCTGELSEPAAAQLKRFVTDPAIASKRPILYVGRLSDEKNISFLIHSYARLLYGERMRNRIHFVFIGSGEKAEVIKEAFGESVTVTGLVPNDLLPNVYNLIRQRHGYFISASDTETYGITHEEASACGVPIVAMHRGTRTHVFCPGDYIGNVVLEEDGLLTQAVAALACKRAEVFIPGLNGVVIPDYSGGIGLSLLPENHSSRAAAVESLYQAMRLMAILPEHAMARMAGHAAEFTMKSKLDWPLSWRLLSRGVYPGNRQAHADIYAPRAHHFR